MKTLKGYRILYDEECPMCRAYTKTFVNSGMLEPEGRVSYQKVSPDCSRHVDMKRAVNEIALVNPETGEVYYGIHSMFRVIGNAFPFLKPLFQFDPFIRFMNLVYKFISYNRRVIMPVGGPGSSSTPAFHKGYRMAWIISSWFLTALILNFYGRLLPEQVRPPGYFAEWLICGGQIVWQLVFLAGADPKKKWDYLGTMMTVSMAGAMALLPVLLISPIIEATPLVYAGWFMLVAFLMLGEHIRRISLFKLHHGLSFSWVLYRITLLFLIVYVF